MRATPAILCFILFSCSPPPPTGVEPEPDAPLESDAGHLDAGATVEDAGSTTEDAGTTVEDAGSTVEDAGTRPDAGTPIEDAGTTTDAGIDAGQPCTCTLPSYCSAGTCVVDATAPVLTVTASAGTTTGKLRVSGTALDAQTGITSVSVRINQAAAVSVPVTQGAYAAELDTTDSEFTIVVTGRDAAGNEATAQTTFDPAGPRITVMTPDAVCDPSGCSGAYVSSTSAPLTISATVTDFALASTRPVTIRVVTAGGTELVPATDMTRSGSSWTWTWANPPALDDTAIDLVITATDAAQNVSSATVHGRIDRVAPLLTATPTQDATCDQNGCTGAVITATTSTLVFSGTANAESLSVRVRDGASVIVPSTVVPLTSGMWSWTFSPPVLDGRFLSVEFTATDVLNNVTTLTRAVLVDRVLPSLLIAAPAPSTLVGSSTVSVVANAADGLGVKAVEVSTQPQAPAVIASLDSNGDYVANVGVPVVDAVEQTLTIRAIDLVGNSRTGTRRYVADRVAPVISVAGTDFDCSGAECTGMVANGSTSSVTFSGTATDGSAISLRKTVVGTTQVATSTDPVTGGAWSWTWSSLPTNVNGAAYELRVVATDAAGNASTQAVRRVWLDNVVPTVTVLPAGQRNVSLTAPMLTYSEPMVVDSILRGTGFAPPVNLATFATTDRRTFAFTTPALSHYTPYQLVAASGTDLAGNALVVMGDAKFLTAPMPRAAVTVVRAQFPGYTYRHPVVAVDSDQQIYASYTATTSNVTVVESIVLDGSGRERSRGDSWGIQYGREAREGEVRIVAETRATDQRLAATLEHSVVWANGGSPLVGYGTQTNAWTTQGYEMTFLGNSAGPTVGGGSATLDLVRPVIDLVPYRTGLRRNFVVPNNGQGSMTSLEQNGATWSVSSPATLTNFRHMDGRASVEVASTLGQFRVRYYDLDSMSEVGTYGFVRAATGQPASKRVDSFFGAPVATSGSFMAWMSDTQLTVACSPAPFVPTPVWRPTALSMPQTQTRGLTSTRDNTRVVFASEFGGNVHVHSTPLNGCSSAPVLTSLGVIQGLKDPNVFIDGAGTVWVAGIATNGSVVVHRL